MTWLKCLDRQFDGWLASQKVLIFLSCCLSELLAVLDSVNLSQMHSQACGIFLGFLRVRYFKVQWESFVLLAPLQAQLLSEKRCRLPA